MRIGVLGPLQVLVGGRRADLGGRLPRRLFAALVARAGKSVSVDALVDAMWGEVPPAAAVKTAQAYVARLRAALSAAAGTRRGGSGVIESVPRGYRLTVPDGVVDSHVFVERIGMAGQAVRGGDPVAADRLLAEAFGLWRGSPYGEFAEAAFAVAEARRLEEVRLAGLETGLDAALLAGRCSQVVAEAEALCAAYPLREQFWARLMTALYRCGRQADALAAFQRVRRLLAEEIGVDAGPALRKLEAQVLRQDPVLDGPGERLPVSVVGKRQASDAVAGVAARLPDERRVGSVLVAAAGPLADVPDCTDPERAEAVLHQFRLACAEAATEAGGVLVERTGTGVVAAFGMLGTYDDHTARALHTALRLRDRYLDAVCVGIATGELLRRGQPARLTVTGEPVRLASALCAAAAPGEVLVAGRGVRSTRGQYEFTGVAERALPGGLAVRCAALVGLLTRAGPDRPRVSGGRPGGFVGRAEELAFLQAVFGRVVDRRRPQLVTVSGHAGIGKSALARRFVAWLGQRWPAAAVYVGRTLGYGQGLSYGAFGEVLRGLLAIDAAASPDQIRHRLSGREILGPTLGLDIAGALAPRDARGQLHEQWVALVEGILADSPAVVFVVEDLHWAQQPMLDLLAHLMTNVAGPLLVIATARPEYGEQHPAALTTGRDQQLWLDPLTDEQADTLLEELLSEQPSDELRDSVLVPAEGNPFFVEEMLAALIDRGSLVRTSSGWMLDDVPPSPGLPDSVRSALMARVDCLSAEPRAALQAAAVVGDAFSIRMVQRLLAPGRPDFAELTGRDFLRRQPGSTMAEPRYAFKHALTRQVAYDMLPVARRARLHAAAADLLADGDNVDIQAGLVAYHYAQAARTDQADLAWTGEPETLIRLRDCARKWLHQAGVLAIRGFAVDDAVDLLHRALEFAPTAATQGPLWSAVAEAHALRFDFRPFHKAIRHAIDLTDDPQQQADGYVELADAATGGWHAVASAFPADDVVKGWLQQALVLAKPETAAHIKATAYLAGWFYPERLAAVVPRVLAAAERSGDRGLVRLAHVVGLCQAAVERRYADALRAALEQVAEGDPGDPYTFGITYLFPVPFLIGLGRFTEARQYVALNEAVAERQTLEDRMWATAWRIEVETIAEEWQRVCDDEERIRRLISAGLAAPPVAAARALLHCAAARVHLGQPRAAADLETLATDMAGVHDDRTVGPQLRLALARGDLGRLAELIVGAPTQLKPFQMWWDTDLSIVRLDALAALGDTAGVEATATLVRGSGDLLDAIVARALGTVHRDRSLLIMAITEFAGMNLSAHAALAQDLIHRL